MSESPFAVPLAHPAYDDHVKYLATGFTGNTIVRAWEFGGWRRESMSWKTGCYIHAGLSGGGPISIKGRDALRYLQGLVINSLERFPTGTMKHAVQCDEDGLIYAHGIIERRGENEFYSFAGGPPLARPIVPPDPSLDVELGFENEYLFQIAGPMSLELLEKVTGESLRDIGFLSFRDSSINGMKTEVGRIGMSGNLAYELHGPFEQGPAVYQAVYEAGQEFGIERLGWGTYLVNHVEGGFPQGSWTFVPTGYGNLDELAQYFSPTGSVNPADMRARRRTPVEVRWQNMARFDHEFIGMDALRAEAENPKRTTMTLRWNPEDVIDIYASLFQPGEEYKPIDLPYAPQRWPQIHADHILKDGREIGWSSGTTYSYYYRELISMACIDIDKAEIGNQVIVQWGDFGGRIKDVRATVELFPYLTAPRNSDVDVTTLT